MSDAQPPDGWDQISEELMTMAHMTRQMYLAFIAAGFASHEAAQVLGAWFAANGSTQSGPPPTSGS